MEEFSLPTRILAGAGAISAPEILPALILGKLAGGISAVALELLLTQKE